MIRVLLINTLVLPYLVDKTISLSTSIPRHYSEQGEVASFKVKKARS